jgi:hypothetical protein
MGVTTVRTQLVDVPDGRRLRVEIGGGGSRVVLAHLGSPNAGVLFEPWVRDAAAAGPNGGGLRR